MHDHYENSLEKAERINKTKQMKAILEFDLNEPDDIMAHKRAVKSLDMALAIWELVYNSNRSILESFPEATVEMELIHDSWVNRIKEVLEQQAINIDELIN